MDNAQIIAQATDRMTDCERAYFNERVERGADPVVVANQYMDMVAANAAEGR